MSKYYLWFFLVCALHGHAKQRVLFVTDTWYPQTNGVVTTLAHIKQALQNKGYAVTVVHPRRFQTFQLPGHHDVDLVYDAYSAYRAIRDTKADYVYIAVEGPLGMLARGYCLLHGIPFVTSIHTNFPDYVQLRFGAGYHIALDYMRWFHAPAYKTLVNTTQQMRELAAQGFTHLAYWGKGYDSDIFTLQSKTRRTKRIMYVGRVAPEKNIEAFLRLDTPYEKMVVGDGPSLATYEKTYPRVHFVGAKHGKALARYYQGATVLVFPSLTDTFGLVMLEAMACGTPVAAFPSTGPRAVIENGVNGYIDTDLLRAVTHASALNRVEVAASVHKHRWSNVADVFLRHLKNSMKPA